jgi:hypothetical protein
VGFSERQSQQSLTLCWGLVFGRGNEHVNCLVAITPANTYTIEWGNNAALWLSNVKDWKSLTLHWRLFLDGELTNSLPMLNHCMRPIVYTLLTSSIAILIIFVCIQKLYGLSISDQSPCALSECQMTRFYRVPALLAGNRWHVDHFTKFWLI